MRNGVNRITDVSKLWILIDKAILQGQIYKAYDYACALLAPEQPPLPEALRAVVEVAVKTWEERHPEITRNHFRQAIKLAQEMGYL